MVVNRIQFGTPWRLISNSWEAGSTYVIVDTEKLQSIMHNSKKNMVKIFVIILENLIYLKIMKQLYLMFKDLILKLIKRLLFLLEMKIN